jgi:two-component system alkaline phosphatase synthesis response regulator PhoP
MLDAGRSGEGPDQPATILCIDDDRLLLSFVSDALERRGFRTLVAMDGPSGIEMAKAERPDLILLDVVMPTMNGLEVCRRLRAEAKLAATPVVLLTALNDPHLGFEGKEAGATTTMRKPFGVEHIIATIERILGPSFSPPQL